MFHPVVNILLTFILIIILLRKKVQTGWVMLSAGIVLGILFKVGLNGQLLTLKRAIISPVFLQLGVALNIIMFLEHVMRTRGYLSKTVAALKDLIPSPKINLMILPAFLGLLPSPGGAVFSAPLVTEAGKGLALSPEDHSLINYWFRHVWEFFIPLYPGVILASQILEVPVGKLSLMLSWFFFITVILGYFLYIRKLEIPKGMKEAAATTTSTVVKGNALIDLWAGIWPVAVIVVTVLIFKTDVSLTVITVLIFLLVFNRYRIPDLQKLWKESFSMSIIFLIIGVLFFKEMLATSGVIAWMPVYLKSLGVPDLLVLIGLTFFVASAIGLSQGYVAATFPLLIGIIGAGQHLNWGALVLAYISGFVGVMLSPVHLCFLLTVDYFEADLIKVWRRVVFPEIVLLLFAILFALFWM